MLLLFLLPLLPLLLLLRLLLLLLLLQHRHQLKYPCGSCCTLAT